MENISHERAIELLKKLVANMRYGGKPLVVAKHLLYVGFEPEELLELGGTKRDLKRPVLLFIKFNIWFIFLSFDKGC